MDGREGKGCCLTLGLEPAFSPSAALIWLGFLMLKRLTPSFSFLFVKIVLDGEVCRKKTLLVTTYVMLLWFCLFVFNIESVCFLVVSEHLALT